MEPNKIPSKALRILLVDDDADSRFLCHRLLMRLGHHVTMAEEGMEAIGLLRDHAWDVVLADQNMPGASGIDVLERAFKLQPSTLRLLMTSLVDQKICEDAQTRGHAHALIEKPIDRGAFEYAGRASIGPSAYREVEVRLAEG